MGSYEEYLSNLHEAADEVYVVAEEALSGLLCHRPIGIGECHIFVRLVFKNAAECEKRPSTSDIVGMGDTEVLIAHERTGVIGG